MNFSTENINEKADGANAAPEGVSVRGRGEGACAALST